MKAFLLAAGHGTRLRPITNKIPKCLAEICGKPLLGYWFNLFRKYGITEILINLNHFPEQVIDYISKNAKDLNITIVIEDKLLGSLGTIIKNKDFIINEKDFFVFYADNLTNLNISKMFSFHNTSLNDFTMGIFITDKPTSCGIVEIADDGTIISFEEKPNNPKTNFANAGIYIMNPSIIKELNQVSDTILDIGYDLLPSLQNKMNGYIINEFLLDIGTLDNYNKANQIVKNNLREFTT